MDGSTRLEPLEKIFLQVEEENERRAESKTGNTLKSISKEAAIMRSKHRRRASITISRFGQVQESEGGGPSIAIPVSRRLSTIASKSNIYQSQLNNGSATSFVSTSSDDPEGSSNMEDQNHVTRMHAIAGRQTITKAVGGLLSRRSSRPYSGLIPRGDVTLAVEVSVEEATSEVANHAEAGRIIVFSPTEDRRPKPKDSGWLGKAKRCSQLFKRNSKSPLRGGP